MNTNIDSEIREVMEALHYRPSVSVIIPFVPKINLETELKYAFKIATDKVEQELADNYPAEISALILQKLSGVIKNVKVDKNKKGIAVYVSPVFERVLYLDVAVEAKIIIDESFEIRDLVYSKKQLHKYLVLLLSGKESRMYFGNNGDFMRIISDQPETIDAYENEAPERVANFSDVSDRKEILLYKFLHHIDSSLDVVLNEYHLPVFVMGAEKLLGQFKQITKHQKAVAAYIHGNYEESTITQLKELLQSFVDEWKKGKQKELMNKIDAAAGKKKLAVGIKEVWRDAMQNKGQLLVVEKNFMYAAQRGGVEDVLYDVTGSANQFSVIKDAVDDVLEKVLANGGDVEFTDEGVLENYLHIVLINYY